MKIDRLDGPALRKMIAAASNELMSNKDLIDSLNVFPVPDGDTGTNMSLTARVAAEHVENLPEAAGAGQVAAAAASGSLRGARGNSGVILSQLFRGFAKGVENRESIDSEDVARAFKQAVDTAYKAVMKPKEGTILTVATAIAEKAAALAPETGDVALLLAESINHGTVVLEKTTFMLEQLRSAGVVDAGGKGLICLLEGAYNSVVGIDAVTLAETPQEMSAEPARPAAPRPAAAFAAAPAAPAGAEYGYCTEFFIHAKKISQECENAFREFLNGSGDSIVLVADDDIIKVHIHTQHPGRVLERALGLGPLSSLKIENMTMQHSALIDFGETSFQGALAQMDGAAAKDEDPPDEPRELGFVAVAAGDGLADYFKGLGVDFVIEGGQTMNPSTNDILDAVAGVDAKNVFVLPNNSNIILAARQAAELSQNKAVRVLPTSTVPQGISAMVAYLPMDSPDDNFAAMSDAIGAVRTGLITYAVRDTVVDGMEIKEDDILCMSEGSILFTHADAAQGARALLDVMLDEGGDFVGIYYGEDTAAEDALALADYVRERRPSFEVECRRGGQPLYYYIFSVE